MELVDLMKQDDLNYVIDIFNTDNNSFIKGNLKYIQYIYILDAIDHSMPGIRYHMLCNLIHIYYKLSFVICKYKNLALLCPMMPCNQCNF